MVRTAQAKTADLWRLRRLRQKEYAPQPEPREGPAALPYTTGAARGNGGGLRYCASVWTRSGSGFLAGEEARQEARDLAAVLLVLLPEALSQLALLEEHD